MSDQEAPFWLRYGARGVGCAGGIIAMALGLFNCITVTPMCLVAGIYQIFLGFIVVAAESPCCCMFIDFIQRYSKFVEERPYWQKALVYTLGAIPTIFMCQSISVYFGSGLVFLAGVLYGMLALGKKGSRSDMLAAAQTSASLPGSQNSAFSATTQSSMKSTLVNMEVPPATTY